MKRRFFMGTFAGVQPQHTLTNRINIRYPLSQYTARRKRSRMPKLLQAVKTMPCYVVLLYRDALRIALAAHIQLLVRCNHRPKRF